MNKKMSVVIESLVTIVLDIFLFFFPTFQDTSNFTNFEIILRSKDCVKIDFQILEEVEIFLEAIFFKKINLIARFLDF